MDNEAKTAFQKYSPESYSVPVQKQGQDFAQEFLELVLAVGDASKFEELMGRNFQTLLTIGFCEGAKREQETTNHSLSQYELIDRRPGEDQEFTRSELSPGDIETIWRALRHFGKSEAGLEWKSNCKRLVNQLALLDWREKL